MPLVTIALTVLLALKVFGSSAIAYSSRLGKLSPSELADAPLMFVFANSAAVNFPARHRSKVEFTLMVTLPCAVLPLVANSPSSNVQNASRNGAVPGVALAEKVTVSGMIPLVTLAEGEQIGPPGPLFFKNHGAVVGSVLKNANNWLATLKTPLLLGWV